MPSRTTTSDLEHALRSFARAAVGVLGTIDVPDLAAVRAALGIDEESAKTVRDVDPVSLNASQKR